MSSLLWQSLRPSAHGFYPDHFLLVPTISLGSRETFVKSRASTVNSKENVTNSLLNPYA